MKTKLVGVSAVIPSFNDKAKVFPLLNSLKKSTYSNSEVIVVVNGNIETLIEGKKKYKWVKWIDAGRENIGQTGCYNLGFANAEKINHILYIDSDVLVDKNMISHLVKAFELNPKIGIVTPMILYLSDKNWVNQAGSNVDLITGRVQVGWGPKKDFLQGKEVQNSGTVMLFKRQVINKIGGLDDWFLCYFDPDYCLRAKKEGFITWYEPSAKCFHDQSKDPNIWRPRVLTRAYLLGRNRVLFMRRHGKSLPVFILSLLILFGYYFIESVKFGIFHKWLELIFGTLVGFFYPLRKDNFIALPKPEDYRPEMKKETILEKIMFNIPFSYLGLFRRSIGNPKTILDLGCGDGTFMKALTRGKKCKIVGVDSFKDVVMKARALGIYDLVIQGDVVEESKKMMQQKKHFDTIFCCQLIEHMSQEQGEKLLTILDKLALGRIVIATPRGFKEAEDLSGHNPHRHHISGWSIEVFAKRGYRVHGLGFKYGLPISGISKVNNKMIAYIYMVRTFFMSPFVYLFPSLGAGILAIKKFKRK